MQKQNLAFLPNPPSWKKHVSEVSVQKSEYSSYYLMNMKILYGTLGCVSRKKTHVVVSVIFLRTTTISCVSLQYVTLRLE